MSAASSMRRPESGEALVVTGSSGFIGSHLCQGAQTAGLQPLGIDLREPSAEATHRHLTADLREPTSMPAFPARVVVHLAALAEAVVPWTETTALWKANVLATANTLEALKPQVCIVASSCAVYGNVRVRDAQPNLDRVGPVGQYGMTKAATELVCRDWATGARRAAVAFRFGNVVGPRCRGLIPFLVNHAVRHADDRAPARLRGGGRIVRDYVPVRHVVDILQAAATRQWPRGELQIFNIGTGRGRTNGAMAQHLASLLRVRGYAVDLDFSTPLGLGEARYAVVDPQRTFETFGIAAPSDDEVFDSIASAVDHHLQVSLRELAAERQAV